MEGDETDKTESLYGKRYCPGCGKAADWEFNKEKKAYCCSRCGYAIVGSPDKLPVCQPILSEEMESCEHDFRDVSDERRRLVDERGLPSWAEKLKEKGDRNWGAPKDEYKTNIYLKCRKCGLLTVKREEK